MNRWGMGWIVAALLVLPAHAGQNVVLLLDDSGSMADPMRSDPRVTKMDAAKQALRAVLEGLPADARIGILALNAAGAEDRWILPLGAHAREESQRAIDRLAAEGGTPLGANMKVAADALLAARERQVYGDYRLLIVTDGEAHDGDLVNRFLPEIRQRGLTVDVIGVSMQQNHSLATRVDRYRRADDEAALRTAIRESLAETPLDAQDAAANADFELLAGLPDEVAQAIVIGVSQRDNRPLAGSEPPAGADGELAAQPGTPPASVPAPEEPTPPERSFPIWAMVVIFFLLLGSMKKSARVSQRRRR